MNFHWTQDSWGKHIFHNIQTLSLYTTIHLVTTTDILSRIINMNVIHILYIHGVCIPILQTIGWKDYNIFLIRIFSLTASTIFSSIFTESTLAMYPPCKSVILITCPIPHEISHQICIRHFRWKRPVGRTSVIGEGQSCICVDNIIQKQHHYLRYQYTDLIKRISWQRQFRNVPALLKFKDFSRNIQAILRQNFPFQGYISTLSEVTEHASTSSIHEKQHKECEHAIRPHTGKVLLSKTRIWKKCSVFHS